jgi:hypothetical protein
MLYTPRLIPTADSSMSSVVRSGLTPMTGIHFSKEVAENPVFKHYVAEVGSPRSYVVEFYVHHFFGRRSSPGSNTWKRTE